MRLTLNQLLFRTSQAKDEVLLPVLTELGLGRGGFITRTAIKDCRRSNRLELTGKGKNTAEAWRKKYRALENKLLAGFSKEEKQQLEELLQRVLDNARKGSGNE